ncbi:MAG: GH3 auxin-responsive promoter family protein [Spirochaetales bacterium]|nr:GH3 auxin-responsive promoter family protein [Spirochaetales bacterium]
MFNRKWLVDTLITIAGKKRLDQIKKRTYNPEKYQREFLDKVIKNNVNTVFGKDHNFDSIKNYEDYCKNVPIRDYNGFNKYHELLQKGESDVLFKGRPAMYNTSSGTTGKPKLIPISPEFYKKLSKFNKNWMYSILEKNEKAFSGKSISSIGKSIEGYAEDGIPIGSVSGNSFRNVPSILKKDHSSPYPFFAIDDYDLRYYAIARNALEQDITISVCASIANMFRYHQVIMENFDEMVEEIREGRYKEGVLDSFSEKDKKDALSRVHPNPERADELIRLKEKYGENLLPKHYWPNLAVANVWLQGNFTLLVQRLREYFPVTTVFRSFGYQASEGRFGISLDNHWTYSLLVPDEYFYEFIPFKNRDDENPPTKLYHELELNERYYIIITNISGLYRYDMNDIVDVVGFHNGCPLIRFVQKGAGIVNIMGEKLSEEQVIDATRSAESECPWTVKNYIMFGDATAFKYEYFVEFGESLTKEQRTEFIINVDKKLSEMNIEYKSKRASNRLPLPEVIELPHNSHQIIKDEFVKRKLAKDGQYKDLYLSTKETTRQVLEELSTKEMKHSL